MPEANMPVNDIAAKLLSREDVPLYPSKPYSKEITGHIQGALANENQKAALHLFNDDIEACHAIAQSREWDKTSNLMHAFLHRREGKSEAFNSEYWLGRVGGHPVLNQVHGSNAKAQAFVNECSVAETAADVSACQATQQREFNALWKHVLQVKEES